MGVEKGRKGRRKGNNCRFVALLVICALLLWRGEKRRGEKGERDLPGDEPWAFS